MIRKISMLIFGILLFSMIVIASNGYFGNTRINFDHTVVFNGSNINTENMTVTGYIFLNGVGIHSWDDVNISYSESSRYLTLTGTVFGFSESELNNTIDARSINADTNESTRMNNIVSNPCGANQYIYDFQADGTPVCRADLTGNGTSDPLVTSSSDHYLYNTSTEIIFNETYLNSTIDNRDSDTDTWNNTEDFGDSFVNITGDTMTGNLSLQGKLIVTGELGAESSLGYDNVRIGVDSSFPPTARIVFDDNSMTWQMDSVDLGDSTSYFRIFTPMNVEFILGLTQSYLYSNLKINGNLSVTNDINATYFKTLNGGCIGSNSTHPLILYSTCP